MAWMFLARASCYSSVTDSSCTNHPSFSRSLPYSCACPAFCTRPTLIAPGRRCGICNDGHATPATCTQQIISSFPGLLLCCLDWLLLLFSLAHHLLGIGTSPRTHLSSASTACYWTRGIGGRGSGRTGKGGGQGRSESAGWSERGKGGVRGREERGG